MNKNKVGLWVLINFLSTSLFLVAQAAMPKSNLPIGYEEIPGAMVQVDIAVGGKQPLVVGVDEDGKAYTLQADWKTWLEVKRKAKMFFIGISIGGDGIIWAVDRDGKIYRFKRGMWEEVVGSLKSISVGNKNEVCGIDSHDVLHRKKDPDHDKTLWGTFGDGVSSVACGGDGTIWAIKNQALQVLDRWEENPLLKERIKPTENGFGNPAKIALKDQFNVVFLDYGDKAHRLVPGTDGSKREHWESLSAAIEFRDVAVGYDGTILGIDQKGKIVVKKPTIELTKQINDGRGALVRATQLLRIQAGENLGNRYVWTRLKAAKSLDIPGYKAENSAALYVGTKDPDRDKRDHIASWFTIRHAQDPKSNKELMYGDVIEIFSLYATVPTESKFLDKDWRWWAYTPNDVTQPSDIVVSLEEVSNTRSGDQLFKIQSPYGLTGPVHTHDTIELVSLASSNMNKCLWAEGVGTEPEGSAKMHVDRLTTYDVWGQDHGRFGAREFGGNQYFHLKVINLSEEIEYKNDAGEEGKKLGETNKVIDVYNHLKGLFYREAGFLKAEEKAEVIERALNYGYGVIEEIRNETQYDIETQSFVIKKQETWKKQALPGEKETGYSLRAEGKLIVEGFARDPELTEFGPDMLLRVGKMYSRGYAWLSESLENKGKATISFVAEAQDQGGIEVVFDTEMGTKADLKVIIGIDKNTKTRIVWKNITLTEVDATYNKLAQAVAGRATPYWVTLNGDCVIVGMGLPGENIIAAAQLPDDAEAFDRIGFSSHDGKVNYAEIREGPALTTLAEEMIYKEMKEKYTLSAGGSLVTLDLPLRVPNEGAISFTAVARHSVGLSLSNKKNQQYLVTFGDDENKFLTLRKNRSVVAKLHLADIPDAQINDNQPENLWVSIEGGILMIGSGQVGDNVLLAWQDPDPLEEITILGFQPAADHAQTIRNVTLMPPVTLGTEKGDVVYKKHIPRIKKSGSVIVIRPFEYHIYQDSDKVSMKDMLSGSNYHVLATPRKDGRYVFQLTVNSYGIPDIKLLREPEAGEGEVLLKRGIMEKNLDAQMRTEVAEGKAAYYDAIASGMQGIAGAAGAGAMMGGIGAMVSVGAGVAAATTGAVMQGQAGKVRSEAMIEAAKARNEAGQKQIELDLNYRSNNSYVHVEEVEKRPGALTSIPPQAMQNLSVVQTRLKETLQYPFDDPNGFSVLLDLYQEILDRTNHHYIVGEEGIKATVYKGIDRIAEHVEKYENKLPDFVLTRYKDILYLLISAISNPYLVDTTKKEEVDAQEQWYYSMLDVSDFLFQNMDFMPDKTFEIPPLFGEYLWLPGQLQVPSNGWITFEASASNDVFVCFAQVDERTRNTMNALYEVVIGGWNNERDVIRIKSLGRSAATSFLKTREEKLSLRHFKSFWMSIENGTVKLGEGSEVGKNVKLSWTDPYPWQNIVNIGLSSWDAPVRVRNIRSSLIVENSLNKKVSAISEEEFLDENFEEPMQQPALKKTMQKKSLSKKISAKSSANASHQQSPQQLKYQEPADVAQYNVQPYVEQIPYDLEYDEPFTQELLSGDDQWYDEQLQAGD